MECIIVKQFGLLDNTNGKKKHLLRQELSNKKSKCRSENNEFKVLRSEIVSILNTILYPFGYRIY